MADKTSFILHIDQYEPIKNLSKEQKGDLLDAFFSYHIDGEVEISDPVVAMAFAFFKIAFHGEQ